MKRIAVMTSGGDAPGMNACVRAVIRTNLKNQIETFGIKRGYSGLIDNLIFPLNKDDASGIIQKGGTILQSARSKRFHTQEGRKKAYHNLKFHKIGGLITIGGNGTFTGANVFLKEFSDLKILGCPGTIDNDLIGTDFTIGYDTAINTAMMAIDNIKDTATAHDRIFFIEVMGRHAGDIALRSALASGAEAVLIPENKTNISDVIQLLKNNIEQKQNSSIIIVAEGDDAGGAFKVSEKVKKELNHFGLSPEIRVTILGHIQRGGRPTAMERVRASLMGVGAVEGLLAGKNGAMVGMIHENIVYTSFEEAINGKKDPKLYANLFEKVNLLS